MSNLFNEALKEKYRQYFINDPLAFMKDAVDWSRFLPLLANLYHNSTENVGRPNIPITTRVRILYLQILLQYCR